MENNTALFEGYLKSVASQDDPLRSTISFIFTDYEPNANNQGIPREESVNIINTANYMPVKVNFSNAQIAGHTNAVPIGPIRKVYEESDKIIGEAVLWKNEFPEVIEYLEDSLKKKIPVNFSWEIYYTEDDNRDGVNWLKNCVVAGITMVDNPAYQGRTPLLSLAEKEEGKDMDELKKKVAELEERVTSLTSEKDDLKSKLAAAEDLAQTLNQRVADSESKISSLRESLTSVTAERDELASFKASAEAEKAAAEMRKTRKSVIESLGLGLNFDQNAERYLSMSNDQFEGYVNGLKAASSKIGMASGNADRSLIPDPVTTAEEDDENDIRKLAEELRKYGKSRK